MNSKFTKVHVMVSVVVCCFFAGGLLLVPSSVSARHIDMGEYEGSNLNGTYCMPILANPGIVTEWAYDGLGKMIPDVNGSLHEYPTGVFEKFKKGPSGGTLYTNPSILRPTQRFSVSTEVAEWLTKNDFVWGSPGADGNSKVVGGYKNGSMDTTVRDSIRGSYNLDYPYTLNYNLTFTAPTEHCTPYYVKVRGVLGGDSTYTERDFIQPGTSGSFSLNATGVVERYAIWTPNIVLVTNADYPVDWGPFHFTPAPMCVELDANPNYRGDWFWGNEPRDENGKFTRVSFYTDPITKAEIQKNQDLYLGSYYSPLQVYGSQCTSSAPSSTPTGGSAVIPTTPTFPPPTDGDPTPSTPPTVPPPSCPNGATNYPTCSTAGTPATCLNGAIDPPTCSPPPTTGGGTTPPPPPPPSPSTGIDEVTFVPLSVTCAAYNSSGVAITSVPTGQPVTWKAFPQGGDGTFTYSWIGTDSSSGFAIASGYIINYSSVSPKSMTVTVNSFGVSASASCTLLTVTQEVPVAPTLSTNTPSCKVGEGKVELWWNAVPDATSYRLFRSTSAVASLPSSLWAKVAHAQAGFTEILDSDPKTDGIQPFSFPPIPANPFLDRDLSPGRNYNYMVKAVGPNGVESPFSAIVKEDTSVLCPDLVVEKIQGTVMTIGGTGGRATLATALNSNVSMSFTAEVKNRGGNTAVKDFDNRFTIFPRGGSTAANTQAVKPFLPEPKITSGLLAGTAKTVSTNPLDKWITKKGSYTVEVCTDSKVTILGKGDIDDEFNGYPPATDTAEANNCSFLDFTVLPITVILETRNPKTADSYKNYTVIDYADVANLKWTTTGGGDPTKCKALLDWIGNKTPPKPDANENTSPLVPLPNRFFSFIYKIACE